MTCCRRDCLWWFVVVVGGCRTPSATKLQPGQGAVTIVSITPAELATRTDATLIWTSSVSGDFVIQLAPNYVVARSQVAANTPVATTLLAESFQTGANAGTIAVFAAGAEPIFGSFSVTLDGGSGGASAVLSFDAGVAYDFQTQASGSVTTATLTVTNSGGRAAVFPALSSASVGLSDPFALTGGTCAGSLAAAASCTLTVTFSPTSGDAAHATLVLPYNDGSASQQTTIALSGNATSVCTQIGATNDYAASGAGTAVAPYVICTPGQLDAVSYSASAWSASFVLAADLDLAAFGPSSTLPFVPIGTLATPFTGTFDGAGHTISNLHIDRCSGTFPCNHDYQGLFGRVSGSATDIRSVTLANAVIAGGNNIGALVGSVDRARILDCHVSSGSVTGGDSLGGLIGTIESATLLSTSSASASVRGGQSAGGSGDNHGGLIGSSVSGAGTLIYNSYATGDVAGANCIGGFGGCIQSPTFYDCYASGNVTASQVAVGGFAGHIAGDIINCFATGNVTGTDASNQVAPFAGASDSPDQSSSAYWAGATCANTAGTCVEASNAQSTSGSLSQFYSGGPVANWKTSVWATTASALPTLRPVTFFDEVAWGGCATHLNAFPFAGGAGTPESPYLVCSPTQLVELSDETYWSGSVVKIEADLDLSQTTFSSTIGRDYRAFIGWIEGDGHTISNFVSHDSTSVYQSGLLNNMRGSIRRIGMTNATVTSNANLAGILAGDLGGMISDCYTTGTISGVSNVGGLAGQAAATDSYTTATVTSTGNASGLMGTEYATANHSFAVNAVNAVTTPGGPLVPCPNGFFNASYYDSSKTCAQCNTGCGVTGIDTTSGGTVSNNGYFFDSAHAPLNAWDFVHVWQRNAGDYPSLLK